MGHRQVTGCVHTYTQTRTLIQCCYCCYRDHTVIDPSHLLCFLVLAELEACSFRNKTPAETAAHMKPLLDKYLPLDASSSASSSSSQLLHAQRQKDHYSHFILRLAFASTEDLRRRFARVETMLFRLRFQTDDSRERAAFVRTLNLDWEAVSDEEKRELAPQLASTITFGGGHGGKRAPQVLDEDWLKVDWMRVPDLVESRRVYVRAGMAYVPGREQQSMVLNAFTKRLEEALEVSEYLISAQRGRRLSTGEEGTFGLIAKPLGLGVVTYSLRHALSHD